MDHPLISADPAVMVGKPCIKGTRITVELILRKLGSGWSIDDVIDSYPHITREGVLAAIAYAADHLEKPEVQAAE